MNELKRKFMSAKRGMEKFPVAELGFDVYLRRMNGLERDDWLTTQSKAIKEEKDKGVALPVMPLFAKLVCMTMCDEGGNLVFTDSKELQDAVDGLVIERVANKALEVNGLTKESRDAIEKKASMMTGSGSTSPTSSAS